MSFWHTVLAVVLAQAIYDLIWMVFLGKNRDDDDDDDSLYV